MTLQLEGISKSYNGNQVLQGCSCTFAGGQSHILMGENGSGKSTLMRIAALLEAPDRGEVRYFADGAALAPDIPLKRRITMVFPRVGVFNSSVFENVAYGLKLRGIEREVRRERVAAALAQVGLGAKGEQPALTLSSGETMSLGLARALAIEPEVLFLDEPTAHLDRANAQAVEVVIRRIREERALTLVMITHDPAQAQRLGGRKLRLEDGKLLET